MAKTKIDEEVKRALNALAFYIRIGGTTRQDLDRRIGQGRGFTSQVLTNRVKPRHDHVLQPLQGANVDPSLYYGLLYPVAEEDRPALKRLQEMFAQFQNPPATTEAEPPRLHVDPDEVKRLVHEEVEAALEAQRPKRRRRRA